MTAADPFRVSVVIPCFNAGAYLRDAVRSVETQTGVGAGEFELCDIVVVDDGSDDPATRDVLRDIAALPVVRIVANEQQKGSGGARNTGIAHAAGDWIAFLDADDVFCDDSIACRVAAARRFPGSRWIGGDFVVWNENGSLEAETFFATRPRPRKVLARAFETGAPIALPRPVAEFIDSPPTHMCCVMAEKSLIAEAGGFDPSQRLQQDFHLFIRMALHSDFVFVPQPVMHYRQHAASATRSETETLRWRETACRKLLADPAFAHYASLLRRKIAGIAREMSTAFSAGGEHASAFSAALRSVRAWPGDAAGWKRLAAAAMLR